jgi:pimeloyl-ACP methyl ester carboxylesterase
MGAEDHLFLPSIKKVIPNYTNAYLNIIEKSGHVVNVDQPTEFNNKVIKFLKSLDS